MNIDLPALFLGVLVLSGAVWAMEALVWLPARRRSGSPAATEVPPMVRHARSLFPVMLFVLLLRSFVFEPYRIPSASMMPGLVDGDFIMVNKFAYGLRLPVLNTKILQVGEPQRGDVVVFRLPSNPSVNYIKRVVGIPGDHVVVRENRLFINSRQVALIAGGSYAGGYGFSGAALGLETFGTTRHVIMLAPDRFATDFDGVVPPGHYFFMGDNRNDSQDSRFPQVGFVPERNLVGHAVRIWMNWRLPGWPVWRRIGSRIT